MASPVLVATNRELVGKNVKLLRAQGETPVVLYGSGKEAKNLTVNTKELGKVFKETGTSTLVDLQIGEGKPTKVLIHDYQMDPVSGAMFHADFLQVKLDEKIQTEVQLTIVGESPAVKNEGGNLATPKTMVNVEAFPQDLVAEIQIDISSLVNFDDKFTVGDIVAPAGITILDNLEDAVAIVSAPRSEEELEAELAPTSDEAEAAAVAATEEASTEKKEAEEAAE